MNLAQLDAWLQALKEKHLEALVYQIAPFAKRKDTVIGEFDVYTTISTYTEAGLRSPFNIDASVVIYVDGSKLYIQFFGVKRELYETEVDDGTLVDFHYQNSTDRPDDISAQEWRKRERVVHRLLDKDSSGIPSRCGFYRTLTDEDDCMLVASYVKEYLKSKEGMKV
jgi:hypothetical protein